jgi:cytochrome c-type biogenesis protein CcmH
MMIWGIVAAVTVVAVAILLWPLLRKPEANKDRAAYDMTVFQDQLKEVERDVERGVLTQAEADAARTEIQRRMLVAGRADPESHTTTSRKGRIALAAGVALGVPALALGVYLTVGAPMLTGEDAPTHEATDADIEKMVTQLAERVAADPKNVEGVTLLARTYRQLGRWPDAAKAYQQLLTLKPDADTYASYGEVLTAGADGEVTQAAHDALIKALSLDRTEPRSRFYLGLEQAEKGNPRDAIAIWRDLSAGAPPDAPWLAMVKEQMAQVAQEANIPPMTVDPKHPLALPANAEAAAQAAATAALAPAPPPPSAPSTSALGGRFSPEQQQMIQGMVGGLAEKLEKNPEDYDGWLMLGRSYAVLQNMEGASKAYDKAIALKPKELEPKLQLVALIMTVTNPDALAPLPAKLTSTVGDILKLDPDQPEALYLAGLERSKAGDKTSAKMFWAKAQKALPETAPLQGDIARRIKALD